MLENLHLIRPDFLWLFVLLVILLWVAYRKRRNRNSWVQFCDPQLVSHLLVGKESRASLFPLFILFISGVLLIIAMAGPAWQKLPQPVYKTDNARVYILDQSLSMEATDMAPSRATRARLKLIDFLNTHKEGQVGLVVFAGEAHVVSPLTDDANTIISMVPSLSTDIMPVQGSKVDRALKRAVQLLTQSGNITGDIVLITDGINTEAFDVAQKLAQKYQLNIVGVGTEEGSPVPVEGGGFLKDNAGAIVIPKLDRAQLKELALAGGGIYVDMTVDNSDVRKLSKGSLEEIADTNNEKHRELDLWQDEGHWFLLAALPFAAFGFRRGWLGVLVIATTLAPVNESLAFEWQDLWQRKDQQAQEALQAGDAKQAAELFENKDWKGAAYYRSGAYDKAAELFSHSDNPEAKYNLANALAKQGELDKAVELYDEIIAKQPNHQDAIFNRDLVRKIMEQENQQQSQNQQGDQSEDSQQQNDQQQSQDGSQSEQQQSSDESQQNAEQQDAQQGEQNDEQKNQESARQSEGADENAEENKEETLSRQQESEQGEEAERLAQEQESQQNSEQREMQQATQQWLRRIPDDPGGLMREKFHRESQRSRQRQQVEQPW